MMLLQQAQRAAESAHEISDSLSSSAIGRALSAATQVNLKIVVTVLIGIIFFAGVTIFALELNAIRKAGGFKKWVLDVPLLPYRTVRMIYISEGVVIVLTLACISHAVWPQIVGEVQMELVYGILGFIGVSLGLNVTAFNIASKNQPDPAIVAAQAAVENPNTLPLVTTNKKTGETTVTPVVVSNGNTTAEQPKPAVTVTAERAVPVETVTARQPLRFTKDE